GDIVIVLPGTYRSAHACGAFRHIAATFRLLRNEIDHGMQSIQEMPGWLILPGHVHVGVKSIEELLEPLRLANAETELQRPGFREMVDALIRQFFVRLYRHAENRQSVNGGQVQPDGPDGVEFPALALQRALEYVHLHLDKPIYVSKVAE